MKLLILVCSLVSVVRASGFVLDSDGWLTQDFHEKSSDLVRVRRQQPQRAQHQQEPVPQYRPYSQAPAQIKQLLQFQQARDPVVPVRAAAPVNLGPQQGGNHPAPTQTQAASYRPNIQFGNAPQQPNYRNQAAAIAASYRPQGQPQAQPHFNPQQNQPQPQLNPQQYQPQGQQPQFPG